MGSIRLRRASRRPDVAVAIPPRVTVLLPFRDAAPTLGEAIGSMRAQGDVPLEIVLVDDGSTDGSTAIARAHADADRRVRLVDAQGAGLPAALARGLAAARAPLVARMDADDVAHPERLVVQLAAIDRAPRVAALGSRVEAFADAEPLGGGMRAYVAWQNELLSPEDHERELFVESPLCHPSVLFRRDAVLAVGGFRDVAWAEDYDLWLRLAAAGHALAKVPETLLRWRHHGGRTTFRHPRYAPARFFEAKARFLAPRLAARGRPVVVWGAGPTGRRTARALAAEGIEVQAFGDIDPRKVGRRAHGAPIRGVDALAAWSRADGDARPFFLGAVGSRGARALLRARFVAYDLVEGDDFLCVA